MSEAPPRPYKLPVSVLVVIHTPALEVLLIERAGQPGFWQSVTGSCDAEDADLAHTARREVAEETGLFVEAPPGAGAAVDDLLAGLVGPGAPRIPFDALGDWRLRNVYEIYPIWRHRYAPGVTHNTEHVFGLVVPPGTPVRLAPREHRDLVWLPWREAADRCFSPSNAEAILQLPQRAGAASDGASHVA